MNQLKHHGILGQKWGVRRYQNKDGSLTPQGKQRIRYLTQGNDPYNKSRVYERKHNDAKNRNAVLTKYATDKSTKQFLNEYVDATIKDAKLKNTQQVRDFVSDTIEYEKHVTALNNFRGTMLHPAEVKKQNAKRVAEDEFNSRLTKALKGVNLDTDSYEYHKVLDSTLYDSKLLSIADDAEKQYLELQRQEHDLQRKVDDLRKRIL